MIRTILFDVGGVLITWKDEAEAAVRLDRLAAQLGYENGQVMWLAFYTGPEWQAAKTGGCTLAQMWHDLLTPHGLLTVKQQQAFVAEMFAEEWVSPAMMALLAEINGRFQLAILSNAADDLESRLELHGVAHFFQLVINSHDVQVAKPDIAAYQITLDRLQAAPETVYFVDNQERNTLIADQLGIHSHIFTDVATLRQDMALHNLL